MFKKNLILLIIFFICYNSYGQFDNTTLKKNQLSYELNLENVTLGETLNIISRESGIAILPSEEIRNIPLNLYFPADETLEDILNSLIQLYGLKLGKSGDIFILSKRGEESRYTFSGKVTSEFGRGVEGVKITLLNSYSQPVFSSYDGNFVITDIEPAVYVAKFEKLGYITKGEIINLSSKNTTLNITLNRENSFSPNSSEMNLDFSQANIIDGEEIITENIHLYNNSCEEIKTLLVENFGNSLKVSTLPKKNILVISGKKDIIISSKNLVKELDKDVEQIRVDAQILDVTDNLFETLGFNWIYGDNSQNLDNNWSMTLLGSSTLNGLGNVYSSSIGISKQFNNGNDILNLGIDLLQATQDLVVSARPSILVLDGEEGSFKVTEEVIVGEEREENDNNDKTISTPIFREAGIILKVTPTIKKDGWIVLKVEIEVSNFKLKTDKDESNESGTYNSEGGSKVGRGITTTIKVKDGETIFIGGLKKATIHNLDSQIPFFGTLPVINFFFKNQNISHELSDIYVKMKVSIVNNQSDSFDRDELHQRAEDIKSKRIY